MVIYDTGVCSLRDKVIEKNGRTQYEIYFVLYHINLNLINWVKYLDINYTKQTGYDKSNAIENR